MDTFLSQQLSNLTPAQLNIIRKPLYTTNASVLLHASNERRIGLGQFNAFTFPIMVHIYNENPPHEPLSRPVLMTIYETFESIAFEIQRAMSAQDRGSVSLMQVQVSTGNVISLQPINSGNIASFLHQCQVRPTNELHVAFDQRPPTPQTNGVNDMNGVNSDGTTTNGITMDGIATADATMTADAMTTTDAMTTDAMTTDGTTTTNGAVTNGGD